MSSHLNHLQNWPEMGQQAKWSASAMAKQCGVSLRTLERYFRTRMGKTPKAWLLEQRQQQAYELLRNGISVKETAYCLNYKHPSHLTNGFKKHWGRQVPSAGPVQCPKN
jgi:AraC-like DNA-binding protein